MPALGVVSREQMELIPYGRDFRTYQQSLIAVPGVLPDFTMLGSPAPLFIVDGARVRGTRLLQDFVEEVGVRTAGFRAEYGGTESGVVDAVLRSGGNEFHGSVFGDLLPGRGH